MKRKPHLVTIPSGISAERRKYYEDMNARILAKAKELEERKAARRAERKAARAAAKVANAGIIASIKVGDVFSMSWGYDQTNVDFFQVVERVGKSSVRVLQVCPEIVAEVPGMMCATRTYKIPHDGTILPRQHYSVFIKDQKGDGDVKRLQVCEYYKDKKVYLNLGGHYAYLETEPTAKHYESWYA